MTTFARRLLPSCLALGIALCLLAPRAALASTHHHAARHARHVALARHHHAHHVTRVARADGETVRVIRAHSRGGPAGALSHG